MRGTGLFLLAIGIVLELVGIGGAIGVMANGRPNFGLFAFFMVLAVVGGLVLVAAVLVMRRGRPIGAVAEPVDGRVGPYLADVPEVLELDGAAYTVHYTKPVPGKNGRPSALRISTPAPIQGEVQIAPESWFDRLGARLGIALEVQTGDEDFDRECYVRSDTPEFAAEYLTDPIKRVALVDLRRFGFAEVTLDGRTASVTWAGFDPHRHDRPDLALEVAARLVLLARNLPAERPEFAVRVGARRQMWELLMWVGLVAFALTMFAWIAYPPVDGWELVGGAAPVALFAWCAFALVSALFLRGTSTSHYSWGRLSFAALLFVPLGTLGTGIVLNAAPDRSPAVVHKQPIVEKYTSRSKNKTRYHVRCTSWRDPGETFSFQVSESEHRAVVVGTSRAVVTTHAGALGVEWRAGRRVEPRPK